MITENTTVYILRILKSDNNSEISLLVKIYF